VEIEGGTPKSQNETSRSYGEVLRLSGRRLKAVVGFYRAGRVRIRDRAGRVRIRDEAARPARGVQATAIIPLPGEHMGLE